MKIKKRTAVNLAYILVFMMVVAGFRGTINDKNRDIVILNEKNSMLLNDIKEMKNKEEVLKEIALRDKRKIQQLLEENEKLRIIRARVTAYAPSENISGICADDNPEVTATGTKPRVGIAAADPEKLEYGTKLYIPGYGDAIIEDTGAALRRSSGARLDVVMNTHEEAMKWGVKELDIVLQM
ncbi:3D (Asp-Asp-Asp) domain-containing protein [Natronincola peptidivorans]|uniref:3D (Asp-Asp-Asp) domain-containing protein n=1 Tax=Natronincola peptidivorans TaxID=426128 RepID=A0A1I0FDZ5_9FIRM|nr:3D domain-containing protein [Natronincola peptidivorans]SET56190.1 3D (Asp-Asp-Asp) domain-containing protein [Natronincola peptidivorans]